MKQTIDIDIVDRLRINWTSMTDMGNEERAEAAAEIERLRAERDEYKDAFEFAHKEFHDALDDLAKMKAELCTALDKAERWKAERDEARQMFCNAMTDHCEEDEARQIAKEQGWDCFKEESK